MELFSRKINTDVESAISPNEKYFALTLFESKKVEIVKMESRFSWNFRTMCLVCVLILEMNYL